MIYFSADHHFGHKNIIKYCDRPFSSVDEMNEEMVARWNARVDPQDTVYYLGDLSLSKAAVSLFVPRLHGEKHLIMGNHDLCHPLHKKKAETGRQVYLESGFKTLELSGAMEIAGHLVHLNHMPYRMEPTREEEVGRGGEIVEKYSTYRPTDRGLWLLHGHVHEKWKTKGRMINVGVDVWDYYPVSLSEIEKIISFIGWR